MTLSQMRDGWDELHGWVVQDAQQDTIKQQYGNRQR